MSLSIGRRIDARLQRALVAWAVRRGAVPPRSDGVVAANQRARVELCLAASEGAMVASIQGARWDAPEETA